MPVGAVARKSGDLGADDQADLPQADVGDQPLEAVAAGDLPGGAGLVLVDEQDLIFAPAQFEQAVAKRPLVDGALTVFQDLLRCGLAKVDDGLALPVRWQDLG